MYLFTHNKQPDRFNNYRITLIIHLMLQNIVLGNLMMVTFFFLTLRLLVLNILSNLLNLSYGIWNDIPLEIKNLTHSSFKRS